MISNIFLAAGGFVLGFLFCAMLVIAWSGEIGLTVQGADGEGKQ